MATNVSPFIVNIVDLQNIATGIDGKSKDSLLTKALSDIGNIQEMVNYDTKTISIDTIKSFTSGHTIDVLANLNLSNTYLYSNSNLISLSTVTSLSTQTTTPISTLGTSTTNIVIQPTNTITFTTAGTPSFILDSNGIATFSNDVYIGGTLHVTGSVQSSDESLKTDIRGFSTTIEEVLRLKPCHFKWKSSGASDIGFIAQEVASTWPDLVSQTKDGLSGIAYSKFVPLLLESIRDLHDRLLCVEDHLRKGISSINNEPTSNGGFASKDRFASKDGFVSRDERMRRRSIG